MTIPQRALVPLLGPAVLAVALAAPATAATSQADRASKPNTATVASKPSKPGKPGKPGKTHKDLAPDRFCFQADLPLVGAEPPKTDLLYCYDFGSSWH
ncbi:hypothetical protein [Thermomonospora catenispora]|uniref:hypothetical protein n=1 Tax=Thermomonospora catenispora TaxID=2493090 RepID=UPI001120F403|nr:hypothetical protein [Thermomonospora catenispora]TNY37841.1 hypothetical protein EIO00_06730 [Thermomonospora catenispora]